MALQSIAVRNLAIAREVEVQFDRGMTVLTGETGAGKSILVDALALLMGGRASAGFVADGCDAAELSAVFELDDGPARAWLIEQALDDGEEDVCIVRRRIGADGRSRCFINARPTPVASLRTLGVMLVDIHGQHAHHLLLQRDAQREALDLYAGNAKLLAACADIAARHDAAGRELAALGGSSDERDARAELLRFQVAELDDFAPGVDEMPALDAEQRRLANGQSLTERFARATAALGGEDHDDAGSALAALAVAARELDAAARHDTRAAESLDIVRSAQSLTQEAHQATRRLLDSVELDPARLAEVEARLARALELARKHRIEPETLHERAETLRATLASLEEGDANAARLAALREQLAQEFAATCKKLHTRRKRAAAKLDKAVQGHLASMGMDACAIETRVTALESAAPSPHGADRVEVLIAPNEGQALRSLAEVASGGELSRIGLALQVSVSADKVLPVLVFDEVDAGIGGAVASAVGERLRDLSDGRQVLCVTHLAQVAACAHRQLRVSKYTEAGRTQSRVEPVEDAERTVELARMIGGSKPTTRALEHAREMLEAAADR